MTKSSRHIHHIHRHPGYSYPVHLHQRLYSLVLVPLLTIGLAAVVFSGVGSVGHISVFSLLGALTLSVIRLTVAFGFALVLSLPLALWINKSPTTERILLPTFDILQSVPVLAFFPVVIVFFVKFQFLEGAAVFIVFINMLWNLVFSLVGGLRLIPGDIKSAAQVFGINRLAYFRRVLIPSVFPYLVTGSLLAWAEGWNMLIVAEVLHTYLPGSSSSSDLFGIGSLMVHAASSGQSGVFIAAIITMIIAIALMNFFIWQKLLHYAERYRFE
ncbi:MAG TPA: ABC transporter permease subunit [Candidatus Saccharimonadales bacterium]|nr:ABC transporter permease subunit [Candidatus Saccharimonadales bacterium]